MSTVTKFGHEKSTTKIHDTETKTFFYVTWHENGKYHSKVYRRYGNALKMFNVAKSKVDLFGYCRLAMSAQYEEPNKYRFTSVTLAMVENDYNYGIVSRPFVHRLS